MSRKAAATIAGHITALLAHPETPEQIFNALREALLEIADQERLHIDHPALLPVALAQLSPAMERGKRRR